MSCPVGTQSAATHIKQKEAGIMISSVSNSGVISAFFYVLIGGITAVFAWLKGRNIKPRKPLHEAERNPKSVNLPKLGGSIHSFTDPKRTATVATWSDLRDENAENYLFEHAGEKTWPMVLDVHTKEKLRNVFKKGLNEGNGVWKIRDNLLKAFPELSPDQAKMIANAELAIAENYGSCKGYLDCEINSVFVIEVEGCSVCSAVNGMIISTKLAICHLLQHAGCRRRFLPMLPGEQTDEGLDDKAFLAAVGQPEYEKAEDGRSIFKIQRRNYTATGIVTDIAPYVFPN
jgi:hypothetical protein